MLHLTPLQWTLAIIAAFGVGLSKSGLAGIGLLHVLIFAHLFGARPSTGVVLPMLICADLLAVYTFRHHSRWDFVRRLLPATAVGVVIGAWLIYQIGDANYQPLIGTIILALSSFQLLRILKPTLLENLPLGLTEFGCHPASKADLSTMYREERIQELATLTDPAVKAAAKRLGIHLMPFPAPPKNAFPPEKLP